MPQIVGEQASRRPARSPFAARIAAVLAARRLPAVFAAGEAAELVLGLIYSQTF